MEVDVDTLMTWARAHAPTERVSTGFSPVTPILRRRVRLEIAAEGAEEISLASHPACSKVVYDNRRIVARAYLAEPRCVVAARHGKDDVCECGPLAETRIG